MILIWLGILGLKLGLSLGEDSPTVTIPDGVLVGSVGQTVGDNTTYYSFRGIPYAQEPVGDLRFADPVANDPWNGTLDATADKDVCTQLSDTTDDGLTGSENCLWINVYTTNTSASLPVMVWIYGGSFTSGSGSYDDFPPDFFIESGVIYVSFNYRLGVFGFLSVANSNAYGNWGLKDQLLALAWVKNNIAYFGGNPNNITIFGESAGSASISYLLQSNLSAGLVQRAIMQSGTTLDSWALSRDVQTKAYKIGTYLGIVALTTASLITQLREVDYKTLKWAESNVTSVSQLTDNLFAGLFIGPSDEGNHSNAVISGDSHTLLKNGNIQDVDIIVGFTSNEAGYLQSFITSIQLALVVYDADNSRLAPYDLTSNAVSKLAAGLAIKTNYLGLSIAAADSDDLIYFLSNDLFNRPIREYARLASLYTNVYYYEFSYEGDLGNSNRTYEGVGHAEDLNYIFAANYSASEEDTLVRNKILALWTNFAIYGNPTPLENDATLDGVTWEPNTPTDDASSSIAYLNINSTLSMGTNPDQTDWEFYQDIYDTYGDDVYGTY